MFGGQHRVLSASPSGKTRYPLCRRLGEPQSRSGTESLVPLPPGIRSLGHAACSKSLYRLRHLAVELYEKLLHYWINIGFVYPRREEIQLRHSVSETPDAFTSSGLHKEYSQRSNVVFMATYLRNSVINFVLFSGHLEVFFFV